VPLKDWNQKSTWDAAYDFGAESLDGHPNTRAEVRLHYHRSVKRPAAVIHASRLAAALGWAPPGPTIVIVGAGFGWTVEALEDLGFDRVVGIDISTYIQGNQDGTEEAEIEAEIAAVGLDPATGRGAELKARHFDGGNRGRSSRGVKNEDGKNGASRGRIKQALGLQGNEQIEWVVSEAVIESLTDIEATNGSDDLAIIGNNVAHFVYTLRADGNQDAGFNWKSLEDWKLLLPSDTFVEAGTYRVL
jgi:hypothetical protein